MGYAQISITLPQAMLKEVEKVQKKEQFTRSEFFRNALRKYMLEFLPTEKLTLAEQKTLKRDLAAAKKGKSYSLDEVLHELGH